MLVYIVCYQSVLYKSQVQFFFIFSNKTNNKGSSNKMYSFFYGKRLPSITEFGNREYQNKTKPNQSKIRPNIGKNFVFHLNNLRFPMFSGPWIVKTLQTRTVNKVYIKIEFDRELWICFSKSGDAIVMRFVLVTTQPKTKSLPKLL